MSDLSPLRNLVAQYRRRAEAATSHSADAKTDLDKLESSDPRHAPTVGRHASLSVAADVWAKAADELEQTLRRIVNE